MPKLPNRRKVATLALDQAIRPTYLMDGDRRIVYANPACERWLGVSVETLAGQRVDYHAMPSGEPTPWQGLCPPLTSFDGEPSAGEVWVELKGATQQRFSALFLPLPSGAEGATGFVMVAIVGPVVTKDGQRGSYPSRDSHDLHRHLLHYSTGAVPRFRIDPLVGKGPLIQQVRSQVTLAATSMAPVLVHGPPGSGRHAIARAIHHARDPVHESRLLPLDCHLVDADLLQATLEAFANRCAASNGLELRSVLLLDVDYLLRDAQAALTSQLRRLGNRAGVIATASQPLCDLAEFHPDLAATLATLTIRVPSLIERLEDLPLLVQSKLERGNLEGERQLEGLSPEALDQLLNHPWRDNLRELEGVLDDARRVAKSAVVGADELPDRIRLSADAERFPAARLETVQLDTFLGDVERELIRRALHVAAGNRAKAARLLGVSRTRLLRRIAALDLED